KPNCSTTSAYQYFQQEKTIQLFWYDIRNFPDSLLIEILARLPVKSIFSFKSVCKHWQTLISHPSFCRFYYSVRNSNAALSSRPFRILRRYSGLPNFKEFVNRLGTEIDSMSEFSVHFLSINKKQYDRFRVLAMSNGLILCCWRSPTPFVYYICDPLTRQWITLPRCRLNYHYTFKEGLITRVNKDHMLTGYTVVRFNHFESDYLNLEMLTSETGKWISYKLPSSIPLLEDAGGPIYCYGALHWRVCNCEGFDGLLAFNPYKDPKSVRLISLPDERDLRREYELCGESQGTLRYF
ncbi:F-box protein At5g49610, partial [Lactuca sativa]|uniref:F-box protein At5g49610 n=1 Tax=Lactuca sativa TaxID=4236 RepID=UPI001C68D93B